jgi:uncharacterized GH25 family protein
MRFFKTTSSMLLTLVAGAMLQPAGYALAQVSAGFKVSGFLRDSAGNALQGDVTVVQGTSRRVVKNIQTNAEGYYEGLTPFAGPAILIAKAPAFSSQTQNITVTQNVRADFTLKKPITVVGRITAPGGSPVANARVRVRYRDSVDAFQFAQEVGDVPTDERGMFSLDFVRPSSPFVLEVEAPGFQLTHSTDLLSVETPLTANVQLQRGGRVRGRIVDENGDPVANAFVSLRPLGPPKASPFPFVTPNTRTSSEGGFEFAGLARGAYRIVVRKEGFKPQQRPVDVSENEDQSHALKLIR